MMESCGCKGIRHCLLCEADKVIERSSKTLQSSEKPSLKLYHFCLHSKIIEVDGWRCCSCSSEKWFADSNFFSEKNGHLRENLGLDGDIIVIEDFITEKEEVVLKNEINRLPWKMSQSGRRKQDFGPKANFKKKKAKIGGFNGLPSFSKPIVEKIQSISGLKNFVPVEVCHLEYTKDRGSCIDPHIDDTWLWGEHLITLNLCSTSILTLSNRDMGTAVEIPIPACSLLVLKGTARYEWMHEIKREDIDDLRIAVTFRELSGEFTHGDLMDVGKQILDIAKIFDGKPLYCEELKT